MSGRVSNIGQHKPTSPMKSEYCQWKLDEGEYFLSQMRFFEDQYQRAFAKRRERDIQDTTRHFMYNLSAFLSATYSARDYLTHVNSHNDVKRIWFKNVTDGALFQFFSELRNEHIHRRVIMLGRGYDLQQQILLSRPYWKIDMEVAFGERKDTTNMSPPYFAVNQAILSQRMKHAYGEFQKDKATYNNRIIVASKTYLDAIREILHAGLHLRHFPEERLQLPWPLLIKREDTRQPTDTT